MRRWLRAFLLALLFSLLFGLAVGTALRMRLERPIRYIGALLPRATLPLDVGDAGAAVLDPRHHEEQVG
jgi:hypothetical protein